MKKTIKDFDLFNKRVIIRCDLNVPIKEGIIKDDNRIIESIPTIKYAIDNGAKVIILSHLGRIKTEEDKITNSLEPVADKMSELLGILVKFIKETRGSVLTNEANKLLSGEIILVQNTRYEDYPNNLESGNDMQLAKYWSSLGDIFINDAFGTAHRSHASNIGIASNLPSGVGFLVEKELGMLDGYLSNPEKPYVVIMGGAKMNDKIKVIDNLVDKADYLLLGGGIANTFLKAMGYDLGISIYDEDSLDYCKKMIEKYKNKIILPVDGYASLEYKDGLDIKYFDLKNVDKDYMVLDIGEKSIEVFKEKLLGAKTVFWNGPVGVSEFKNFEYGTKSLCEILDKGNAKIIIGGGDSAAAAIKFGYKDRFEHISTGGGASLELLEGKKLPGIEAIDNK